ncbi:hypothetical protein [Luteimonas saliphila]|uniref:hypothetical protein n=1 Tax=Luteimonas saliphila TaxID=2804919 RepID=UPI00192DFE51|nr:hypothetical protein [Luteimonas saliphila]
MVSFKVVSPCLALARGQPAREYSGAAVTVVSATVANAGGGGYVRDMAPQSFRNANASGRNPGAANNRVREAGCSPA